MRHTEKQFVPLLREIHFVEELRVARVAAERIVNRIDFQRGPDFPVSLFFQVN